MMSLMHRSWQRLGIQVFGQLPELVHGLIHRQFERPQVVSVTIGVTSPFDSSFSASPNECADQSTPTKSVSPCPRQPAQSPTGCLPHSTLASHKRERRLACWPALHHTTQGPSQGSDSSWQTKSERRRRASCPHSASTELVTDYELRY